MLFTAAAAAGVGHHTTSRHEHAAAADEVRSTYENYTRPTYHHTQQQLASTSNCREYQRKETADRYTHIWVLCATAAAAAVVLRCETNSVAIFRETRRWEPSRRWLSQLLFRASCCSSPNTHTMLPCMCGGVAAAALLSSLFVL